MLRPSDGTLGRWSRVLCNAPCIALKMQRLWVRIPPRLKYLCGTENGTGLSFISNDLSTLKLIIVFVMIITNPIHCFTMKFFQFCSFALFNLSIVHSSTI